jgi:hypothetical protein
MKSWHGCRVNSRLMNLFLGPRVHYQGDEARGLMEALPPFFAWRGGIYQEMVRTAPNDPFRNASGLI